MQVSAQAAGRETLDYVELVRRIGSGERAAEAAFALAFEPGIRALVRRQARPGDPIVDDLVQDVLQTVILRLRENALLEPEALPAYVRSAVVFATRAEYRRRGRRGENDPDPPSTDALTDPDEPSEHTRRQQLRAAVHTLLAELAVARDREILRRFYLEEEDRDSVCAALGIESDHFHRVLHRARTRMKQLLVSHGMGDIK